MIIVPNISKEDLEIDQYTGTSFWEQSIQKEMENLMVAFKNISHEIRCHIIFDINMYFNSVHKAMLVEGSHMTDPLESITYTSVVSRDNVHIAFMLAALNDIDMYAAGIGNA